MRTILRVVVWLVIGAAVLAGALYAALPWLVHRVAPPLLARYGVEVQALDIERPSSTHVRIGTARLQWGTYRLELDGAHVEYTIAGLRQRRVASVVVDRLLLVDDSEVSSGFTLPERVETLWELVPVDRVVLRKLDVRSRQPEAVLAGTVSFDASSFSTGLAIESPLLPAPLTLEAKLDRAGPLDVSLGALGQAAVLDARAVPEPAEARLNIDATTALEGPTFELVARLAGVAPERGRLRAAIKGALPWPLPTEGLIDHAALKGSLELDFAGTIPEVTDPAAVSLAAAIEVAEGVLDVEVAPGAVVTALGRSIETDETAKARVEWAKGVTHIRRLSWKLRDTPLDVTETIRVKRARVVVSDAVASAEAASAKVVLDTDVAVGELGAAFEVRARLAQSGDSLDVSATIATRNGLELPVEVDYDLDSGAARFTSTPHVTVKEPLLSTTLSGWKEPADVTGGTIDLDVSGQWNRARPSEVDAAGHVLLSNVAAHWAEYAAQDIGGRIEWRVRASTFDVALTPLTVGMVDVGVPIAEIVTRATCCEPVHVEALKGRLFGGSFAAAAFDYDISNARTSPERRAEALMNTRTTVTLEGLSLTDLVALQGGDVSATGTLDGQLPVAIDAGEVSVQGGKVVARAPGGHIAYQDATSLAAAAGQPGLDFALRALSDFTYEQLEADVDYAPDGTLALGMRLRGRNPSVEKNRPIQYNLNVTQNVLHLLQSLRLSDRVGEGIEKRLVK